jgi:rod shape determining protein RodA
MLDRRLLYGIDWVLLLGLLVASALGVALVYSATRTGASPQLYLRQLLFLVIAFTALGLVLLVDYHTLIDRAEILYLAICAILIYLPLFGSVRAGTRRWLEVGSFTIQPGEFAKLAVVFILAKYFAAVRRENLRPAEVAITCCLAGIPALLVAFQPDLGTAATLAVAYVALAVMAGLRGRVVWAGILALALLVPMGSVYFLKDYQKDRLRAFVDPRSDPRGAGYQSIQSTIAVGSGGLTGKGWLKGSQSQLQFLPKPHTDFVFAVLAEEFGFIGVAAVGALYLLLTLRGVDTARRARDRLGMYLVAGILSMFVFQAVYNIAMVAGLVPIKGFPLPLLSYGGSSLVATLLGFGVILNVRMRRFAN